MKYHHVVLAAIDQYVRVTNPCVPFLSFLIPSLPDMELSDIGVLNPTIVKPPQEDSLASTDSEYTDKESVGDKEGEKEGDKEESDEWSDLDKDALVKLMVRNKAMEVIHEHAIEFQGQMVANNIEREAQDDDENTDIGEETL